jgi:hypothetical protein
VRSAGISVGGGRLRRWDVQIEAGFVTGRHPQIGYDGLQGYRKPAARVSTMKKSLPELVRNITNLPMTNPNELAAAVGLICVL